MEKFALVEKVEIVKSPGKTEFLFQIFKLSRASMVLSISIGQLGLAAWACFRPAAGQLLIS